MKTHIIANEKLPRLGQMGTSIGVKSLSTTGEGGLSEASSGDAFVFGTSSLTAVGGVVNATGGEPYTDGEIVPLTLNEYGEVINAGYDRSADASRIVDINSKNTKRSPLNSLIALTTSSVTTTEYIDMSAHDSLSFQFILGVGDISVTFGGALLDDGTAAASCSYADITDDVVSAAAYTKDYAVVAERITSIADPAGLFGQYKYIRITVVPNAATVTVHARKEVL